MDHPQKVSLLIRNCAVLPMDGTYYEKGFIAVNGSRIAAVGGMADCDYEGERVIDAAGCVAMPGMINGHTHMGMGYMRAFADDMNLYDFIDRTFQPVLHTDGETVYLYTMLNAMEMMQSGYTMVADSMYQLGDSIRAITDAGMRGKMCETTVDFHEEAKADRLVQTADDYYLRFNGSAHGRVTVDFCLHGTYSCSERLLLGIAEAAAARKADIQIHVSESLQELADLRQQHSTTPTQYLEKLGILSDRLIAAHYVQVNDRDMDLARDRGMRVVHNLASNLKLASGIAPLVQLRARGIPVGLGTDSSVTNNRLDAFDTMKLTALVHKGYLYDAAVLPARTILEMNTIEGARVLGMEHEIGSLERGKLADLILVYMAGRTNYTPWVASSMDNTISNLVYSGNSADVETVIIDGEIVMDKGRFLPFDGERLVEQAQRVGLESLRRAKLL